MGGWCTRRLFGGNWDALFSFGGTVSVALLGWVDLVFSGGILLWTVQFDPTILQKVSA